MLKEGSIYKIAIGARPRRAKIAYKASEILSLENDIEKLVKYQVKNFHLEVI